VLCKVCGKPIWGEGYNPETNERCWSHVHDGKETHDDGSKVEPAGGKVMIKFGGVKIAADPKPVCPNCGELRR
jgi:hypothetical protein